MSNDNTLLTVALIAVVVAAVSFGVVYFNISNMKSGINAYATYEDNATVNVTIASSVVINFSVRELDFGQGSLVGGKFFALLDSAQNTSQNGTWLNKTNGGLLLDNIGTQNVTIELRTFKNATSFISPRSGVTPVPLYKFNVSNALPGSCNGSTADYDLGSFADVNTSYPGTRVCDKFGFVSGNNRIRIDIQLGIPQESLNGSLSDIISARASG